MATWKQTQLELDSEAVSSDAYLVESNVNNLNWVATLPIKVRNKLAMSGITTLPQLMSMSEQEIIQIKQLGPKAIESIRQLLASPDQKLEFAKPEYINYGPFWQTLTETHRISLDTISDLSPRAINALRKVGITSVALLLLVSSSDLMGLPAIGAITTAQIQKIQHRLSSRLGLLEVVGTMKLSSSYELARRFAGTTLDAEIASSVADTRYGLELILNEVSSQRLHEEFVASFICGTHSPLLTLDSLRLAINSAELKTSTFDESTIPYIKNVKRLLDALEAKTLDEEIDSIRALLGERVISILRHRYDPFLPMTLEQVGQLLKLTRERVRQLQVKAVKQLDNYCRQHPLIRTRSAIWTAVMTTSNGGTLEDIEGELRHHNLIGSDNAFTDLLVIWQALNLEHPFIHDQNAASNDGLSASQLILRKELRRNIDKLCRNCGTVSLQWLPTHVTP